MTVDPPLRRDAERNRRRILDAAAQQILEHGLGVALEDIARAAGVGIGTLYRRFADREALVEALFDAHVDGVVALAERVLAEDRHGRCVERFVTAVAERQAAEFGLSQVLRTGPHGTALAVRARERIGPLAERLLERDRADGSVAPGIGAGDLVLIEIMIGAVQRAGGPQDDTTWRRALSLVLGGLRTGVDGSGAAPDDEAIDRLQGPEGR
ncbi:helix-turn-helix domain-containing protein [Pseudonocardia alni]|uniref:TetR/AcrR family transcriptional regulator n=1 Tax=Pseudonocardia alni TaxID=33907 RepID=UPI0033266FF5